MTRLPCHLALSFFVTVVALVACGPAATPSTPTPQDVLSATPIPSGYPAFPAPTASPPPYAPPASQADQAAPRVLRRDPGDWQTIERRPTTSLTFDRAMNQQSVAAALSVEPPIPLNLSWEDMVLHLVPAQPLAPGGHYTFTLAQSAMDIHGFRLAQDYRWDYELPDLIATSIRPSKLAEPLAIHFNYPMDAQSVRQALSLEPPITGTLRWEEGATVALFTPSTSFPSSTTYTVRFAGPLFDANGDELPLPAPISFTTPPPILAVSPAADASVSPATAIKVTFDRPMDHAATEAAFAIHPDVPGSFEWRETTLIFKPENGYLDENAGYTVTVSTEAKASDGTALFNAAYSWSFRTGAMQDMASFGEGPNAQVLDADGRRAIQFALAQKDTPLAAFELYRLNLEQFLDRYSSGFRGVVGYEKKPISTEGAPLVRRWQLGDTSPAIQSDFSGFILETRVPSDVLPGAYILNLTSGRLDDQLILLITRRAIAVKQAEGQLVAWVTDINGVPASGVEVGVYARNGQLVSQGQADEDGVYRAAVGRDPQPLIVIARDGEDLTASGLSNEWQGYGGYWQDWWQPTPKVQKYAAYIYTDRPIYRPGQTVYFKAIVRRDDDAVLGVPPQDTAMTVRVRDARNNVVQTIQFATNQFGTVNGEFKLAEGAMLGDYAVEITVDGEGHRQVFKVQDYRKPDYEVTLAADAESYVAGDTIRVTVDSRYFFGEPVPNAKLIVKQYALGQNYCWESCEGGYVWYDSYRPEISGQTDAHGRFSFTLNAELGNYVQDFYWWSALKQSTWGIEATVDDGSHQAVSSFTVVKVFNAAEQIRLDTGGYLKTPGQAFDVRASDVTIFDQPVSGRELLLQLRRWSPNTGDYTTVVHSIDLTTDASGLAAAPVTVAEPGYYQVHLAGRDRRGNELSYDSWLYVFGDAWFWEPRANNDLSLAADKETYAPGDMARLIVESSFSGPALLTFERGTTRREQLVNLTAPLTRVDVPIQPDDAPNIFVTVNAWKEEDTTLIEHTGTDYYYYTSLADSRLRTASVNLHVPVTDKTLTITLTPDKTTYAPREPATFTVSVTNGRGEPVAAEVSLALVDEAIFSLSDELSGPIFDAFYFERSHIVRTYDSMALRRTLWMGFDGGRGGGGGDSLANPRSNFPDTAAWIPVLYTDWKGEAVVTFPLPDSLTRWRLTAKAVTTDAQVGETFANIVTKQETVVRPLLPRALTAGDRVELSAMVHNYGEGRRDIAVSIESNRLKIVSQVTQTISLAPGEQRIVGWSATAMEAGEAEVTVRANPLPGGTTPTGEGGGVGDAVKLTIPIQPLAIPDVTTQIGDFSGEFNTTVTMPGEALDLSTVKIELSRSIAGSLLTGLEYLTGFPYGCVEQTMSKALPNAVVGRAFHQLGVGNPTLQADLPPKINASVQRLYGFQHNDGGWGWWFDDNTDAYQTAWVVFGLSVTAEAGYEVDSGVVKRGVEWLSAHLDDMDSRTRAFALYSMSAAGYGDLAATRTLAHRPDELDTFSQAALALALQKLGAAADAQKILDGLAKTAVVKEGKVYWPDAADDGHYHEKTMSSTLRSTALALEAFVQISPNHELESGIVRYLMSQRRQEGWGSTNETSFTILALTDHLLAKEIATADTHYSLELNGQVIAGGALGKGEPAVSLEIPASQMVSGDNRVKIQQGGDGRLYYVISRRVYLPQAAIEAAGNVQVSRAYLDPKTNAPITATIAPGQLVKVQLNVTLPEDGFYLLVEDKLPGGLEALNEGLNITSHESSAYGYCSGYECYEQQYRWQEYGYNNKEVHGDRVTFFITEVGQGQHTYTYYARATRTGEFVAMPAEVWAMYDLTVWGRSASSRIVVE